MAKFYGKIGFGVRKETSRGVWKDVIEERSYYGEVQQFMKRWESGDQLNDDLNIDNRLSILADPFAHENVHAIRYVEWMGVKWKVKSVKVKYPRLALTIGGLYNAKQT